MGEVPFSNPERGPNTIILEGILEELSMQRKRWEKTDEPVMAAQCEALYYAAMLDPKVAALMVETHEFRKQQNTDLSYSEVVGVIRTTLMMDQVDLNQKPQKWRCRSDWIDPIREIASLVLDDTPPLSELARADRLRINLMVDKVGTTPFTRASAIEILMQSIAPYRSDKFRVLDIGSGRMQSLLQILCKHEYGFDPVTLYSPTGNTTKFSTWEKRPDLTVKANELLDRPHKITKAVATDLIDPYKSIHNAQWSEASLRVTSEQDNPHFMDKARGLAKQHPAELTFEEVDFTNPSDVDRFKSVYEGTNFDVVIMSTVQHQLSPIQRKIMDNCALSVASEDAFIIKQDFFSVSASVRRRLNFYKHWHLPGRYRLAVYQPNYDNRGWQECFAGYDSRMTRILTSWGSIALNGNTYTPEELILEA